MHPLMYDRGRGPELRSCRITVYDLIPYLLEPNYQDELVFQVWPFVSPDELVALKKYIADHRDEVMAVHLKIEERNRRGMEAQNTPEFLARSVETRKRMYAFRDFLAGWKAARGGDLPMTDEDRKARLTAFSEWYQVRSGGDTPPAGAVNGDRIPSFREWLAARAVTGQPNGAG